MPSSTNLFTFDWGADVTDAERDALFDRFVAIVRRYRMETPAVFFLETVAPLSYLGGQGAVLLSPFLAPVLPGGLSDVQRISKILESPDNVRRLIDRIADEDDAKPNISPAKEQADAAR
jgi:hypothetical protein